MVDLPTHATDTWFNPAVLKWAREWRGRTVEQAAQKVNKSPRAIRDWEAGLAMPTVRQARQLLDYYGRSFLELFLDSPPDIASPGAIPDFRMQRDATPAESTWELRETLQWAEAQRINALDLYVELGEEPPSLSDSLYFTLDDSPDEAAAQTRDMLSFPIEAQLNLTKRAAVKLPTMLRQTVEVQGVLTLRVPGLKKLKVRGICIALFPLPVIVFSNEAPTAQAFTIVHELAHVLLRQSGISGKRSNAYRQNPVERWCDRFASSFLMPTSQIVEHVGPRPDRPAEAIPDDTLKTLADTFRVSPHAMLIRLVHLGYVAADHYWGIKRAQFERDEDEFVSYGRSEYYGSRYRATHGDLYTRLVLEVWAADRIPSHIAAEYMGIKNITHLLAVRDHFAAL